MSASRENLVERINLLEKKLVECDSLGMDTSEIRNQLKLSHEQLAQVNHALNENKSVLKG